MGDGIQRRGFVQAGHAVPLLKHSCVSPSVATDVMVKKHADGLPLYRQEQQWDPPGCAVEAWHDGELDDPAVPEILRKVLEADAGRSCEAGSDPRRRDGVPDAEGEGQGPDFGIPNVGIRFLHMSG